MCTTLPGVPNTLDGHSTWTRMRRAMHIGQQKSALPGHLLLTPKRTDPVQSHCAALRCAVASHAVLCHALLSSVTCSALCCSTLDIFCCEPACSVVDKQMSLLMQRGNTFCTLPCCLIGMLLAHAEHAPLFVAPCCQTDP